MNVEGGGGGGEGGAKTFGGGGGQNLKAVIYCLTSLQPIIEKLLCTVEAIWSL